MRRWRGLCMFVLVLAIGAWIATLPPGGLSSYLAGLAVVAAFILGCLYLRALDDAGKRE